jgi:Baseplate J-like protein
MSCTCGNPKESCCCDGVHAITPQDIFNRPGLKAIQTRIGTHAQFFETMQARLSSEDHPALRTLNTRERHDPSIAMLDAWATVADTLSFYNERLTQEHYLRTATERRSVLELARLVGYEPRPGVAASTYLAYQLEKDQVNVTIPKGARVQSVPIPGSVELPQSFETSEDLVAQAKLNTIRPRMTRPQVLEYAMLRFMAANKLNPNLNIKGLASNVRVGTRLMLTFNETDGKRTLLYQVASVRQEATANRTEVQLQWTGFPVVQPTASEPFFGIREVLSIFIPTDKLPEYLTQPDWFTLQTKLQELQPAVSRTRSRANLEQIDFIAAVKLIISLIILLSIPTPGSSRKNLIGMLNESKSTFELQTNVNFTLIARWIGRILAVYTDEDLPSSFFSTLQPLSIAPSKQLANAKKLERNSNALFATRSDLIPKLFEALNPESQGSAYKALESSPTSSFSSLEKIEIAVVAKLFGAGAPQSPEYLNGTLTRRLLEPINFDKPFKNQRFDGFQHLVLLDTEYEQIHSGSRVVFDFLATQKGPTHVHEIKSYQVQNVTSLAHTDFGLTSKAHLINLNDNWQPGTTLLHMIKPGTAEEIKADDLPVKTVVQNTTIYISGESLELAEETITEKVCLRGETAELELDGLYQGLEAGRWVIVQGERLFDADGTKPGVPSGVTVAELAMIASVRHVSRLSENDPIRPGDKLHTVMRFARPLNWCFKRDTVIIHANVVKATHGETRTEVLGSGDASKIFQEFELRQPPLTYTAAPTAVGAESTLELRVDGVRWNEAPHLVGLGTSDRRYTIRIADDGKTRVGFGNGVFGARLPSGRENLTVTYRTGIGDPGNVKADQISTLASKPLGVKGVINPIRASGGASRETRDQARRNAPLAVMALDRLVSVRDYEDFARTFAGIGRASAQRLPLGGRAVVHVTIAGANDIPIDQNSDLYQNLYEALYRLGDPNLPLQLSVRELRLLFVNARVRLDPAYRWDLLEPKIRAVMLERFGFEARNLGQSITSSEVLSVIQGVPGVEYVDLGAASDNKGLGWIDSEQLKNLGTTPELNSLIQWATNDRVGADRAKLDPTKSNTITSAQMLFLTPLVPDTLILSEIRRGAS